MTVDITRPTAHDALSLEELARYHLMMDYRATLGLGAIPLSKGLTATAGRHVLDTRENIWAANLVLPDGANLHSWSDAPYFGDHRAPQVMWDAPERIGTGYTGNGYEISAAGYGSIASALEGWQGSPGHNAVIAQTGVWANPPFLAIGIGVETSAGAGPYGGRIYHVWFGHQADPTGVPDILGSAAGDNVRATGFADRVFGLGGDDTLLGEGGADLLDGGLGADSLVGGAGNDTYRVNTPLDRVLEQAGAGSDHVLAWSSFVLPAEVERLTLAGTAAVHGTGNGLANAITGNGAANRLLGGGGNDVLSGGGGDDTLGGGAGGDRLLGGAGADHFRFGGPAEGWDRIVDFGPEDVIEVSRAGFGGVLAPGALEAAHFSGTGVAVGPAAQFVYVPGTGVLRWDADGAGGAISVPIAVLEGLPALSAADITVIA
jgi:Ca2+-binding RTX toxin-like protein